MAERSSLCAGVIVLLLCLVLAVSPLSANRQLRFVTLVYRHGDRSPVRGYPSDVHKESDWPQGYGQLTQTGMKQHWDLGQELRVRYKGFLNESYNRHEIYVRSTDVDRTLMSAEANLAGLYPPAGAQVFNPNITWQPIPVHTIPDSQDQLLKFPLSPCPKYVKLQEETRQSEEYINVTRDNKDFLQMVANKTGLSDCSLESVWTIYDIMFCEALYGNIISYETPLKTIMPTRDLSDCDVHPCLYPKKTHNLSLPSWASADVLERLRKLKDFSFRFLFGIHQRIQKARLQGGILVNQIVKNMTAAAHNSTNRLKLIAYSAHDTTLGAMQMALDVYNGKQSPYASCHMFELYEEDSGNFTVEMYYRNESGKEPYPLSLPGCAHSCPLQEFQRLLQPIFTQDWKDECQDHSTLQDSEVIIGLVICAVILFILIILLVVVLFRQKSQPSGYQHVSDVSEEHT